MARMLGIHASIIRGSIGGNTFLAGPNHQIVVRQKTSPVNPNTTRQAQMRTAFAGSAADWNTLTDAQRRLWELYAQTVTIPNPVNPIVPTGRQMFVGNLGTREYLVDRGETFAGVIDTAPNNPGRLVMANLAAIAPPTSTTGFQIQVSNPNPESMMFYVFRSPKQNPARNTYQGVFDTETLTTATITAAGSGVVLFETPNPDEVYFVRVRAIVQEGAVRTSGSQILRAVSETVGP